MGPYRIEIINENGTLPFGPRVFGQVGKDIIAIKIALNIIKDLDGLEASRPDLDPMNTPLDPSIPLDSQRWFDCNTGRPISLMQAATFDDSLKSALLAFQIKNQFLITCYLFEKYGIGGILANRRKTAEDVEKDPASRGTWKDIAYAPEGKDTTYEGQRLDERQDAAWYEPDPLGEEYDQQEYFPEMRDGERYDRVILRVLTAMLDLFNQEVGNLFEATLAVMHGWRPHTIIGLQGYNHIPAVHKNGPVVDIIPEVLAKEAQRGSYGQTIDDLKTSGYLATDPQHADQLERYALEYNNEYDLARYKAHVDERRNWVRADDSATNFDYRYASLEYNVIYDQKSILYSSAIKVLNNSELLDSLMPTSDQREQSLKRFFYPDPFTNPEPFYIDKFTTGHFTETDFVLEQCGPFPQYDEQTIVNLENRALRQVLDFYEKPDIWCIPANEQYLSSFQSAQFGNVRPTPEPEHSGIYPSSTNKAMKMAIPRFVKIQQDIEIKQIQLNNDFSGGDRNPQVDQLFNWGLSDEMPNGCDIEYIKKYIDYDDEGRIKGRTVSYDGVYYEENINDQSVQMLLPTVDIKGSEHLQLNNEEVACLEKYETLKEQIKYLKQEFEKEPTQSEKSRNFWVLTTDDILQSSSDEDKNNYQSWRDISNIGRTDPLIKFIEYRTPSLRTGQTYRALFHINAEKLNFILDGEVIREESGEGDPAGDSPSPADLFCADLSGDSQRTLDDWRMHARKRRREIVRRLKDGYKEQDMGTGPGEVNLGSLGPFDMNAAASSAGSEFLGVNTLGGDDYTYTKAVMSLPGLGVDSVLGATMGDMNDITSATDEQFKQMAAFDDGTISGTLSDKDKKKYRELQQSNTLKIPLVNLKERIKIVKKDLSESYDIALSEGLDIDPRSNFEPNNEGSLLSEFVSDVETLIKTKRGGMQKFIAGALENRPNDIMLNFSFQFVYDESSAGFGPLIGKKITKLVVEAPFKGTANAPGASAPAAITAKMFIDEAQIRNNGRISKTFTRPRTVNYISNILKMTNKSGDRLPIGDGPWTQAFGSLLDDGRGACKDIGINMDKHLSSKYLSKYTSGLKPVTKKGKSEGNSYKKNWWQRNFEDPASQWWKQSTGLHKDGQTFEGNENDAFKLAGKVQTVGDLYDQFLDKIDLASLLCDYLKCIKMPTVNLKLPDLYLPPFPKVPIWGQYPNQWKFLKEQLAKLLYQLLLNFISTLIDSLVSPFCEEQLREFIAAGSSAGGPIFDQALAQSLTNLGDAVEKDKAESAKKAFGDVAKIVTGNELCGLMAGQTLDAAGMSMVRRVTSEGMQTEMTDDEVANFFQVLGSYVPDNLCEQISQITAFETSQAPDCSDIASELQSIRNRLQAGDGDCVTSEELQRVLDKAERDLKNTENSLREFSGMEIGSMVPPGFGIGNPNAIINTLPDFLERELQTTAENVFMSAKLAYQGTLSTYVPYMSISTADHPDATKEATYFTDNELIMEANSTRLALYGTALEQSSFMSKAEVLKQELTKQEYDDLIGSASDYEEYMLTPQEVQQFILRDEKLKEDIDIGILEIENYKEILESDDQMYQNAGVLNLDVTQAQRNSFVTNAKSDPSIIFDTSADLALELFLPYEQREEIYGIAGRPRDASIKTLQRDYTLDIYRPEFYISDLDLDGLTISDRYINLYDSDVPDLVKLSAEGSILRDIEKFKIRYNVERFKKWMNTFKQDDDGKIFQLLYPEPWTGPWRRVGAMLYGNQEEKWQYEARTKEGVLISSRLEEDRIGDPSIDPREHNGHFAYEIRDEPYTTEQFNFGRESNRMHTYSDEEYFDLDHKNKRHSSFIVNLNLHMVNNYIKLIREQYAVYLGTAHWRPYRNKRSALEGIKNPTESGLQQKIITDQNIKVLLNQSEDFGVADGIVINETKPLGSLKKTWEKMREDASTRIEKLKEYGKIEITAFQAKMLYTMFETEEIEYVDPDTGGVQKRKVHVKYAVTPTTDPQTGEKYIPFICAQHSQAGRESNYFNITDSQGITKLTYSVFSKTSEGDQYHPRKLSYEEYVRKVNDPENEDMFVLSTIACANDPDGIGPAQDPGSRSSYPWHPHVLGLNSTAEIDWPIATTDYAGGPFTAMTEEVVKEIAYLQGLITAEQRADLTKAIGMHYGGENIYDRMHGFVEKTAINNPDLLKAISDRVRLLSGDLETALENRPSQISEKHLLMMQKFIRTEKFIAPELSGLQIRDHVPRPSDLKIKLEFNVTDSYSPSIVFTQKPAKKNQDRFDISVESDFHILQSRKNPAGKINSRYFKQFKYCESIPDRITKFNERGEDKYFSKNEAFSKIVTNSLKNNGISTDTLTSTAHSGLYTDVYKDVTETVFQNMGNSFRESPLFDEEYAGQLHNRLAAEVNIDEENKCIRNRYGLTSDSVLDFNKIILSDAKKEYYKEASKPENSAFNQTIDSVGPLEKSLQNLALVAFVRVCLIDTLLKGGLAFSDWDIEPVITEPLYKDYIIYHVKLELDRNRNCKHLWRDILERTTGITNTDLALKSLIEEELIKLPDYSKQVFNPNTSDEDGIDWYTKNYIPVCEPSSFLGPTTIQGAPGLLYSAAQEVIGPGRTQSKVYEKNTSNFIIETYVSLSGKIITKEIIEDPNIRANTNTNGLGLRLSDKFNQNSEETGEMIVSTASFNMLIERINNVFDTEVLRDIFENSTIKHGSRLNLLAVSNFDSSLIPTGEDQSGTFNISGPWPNDVFSDNAMREICNIEDIRSGDISRTQRAYRVWVRSTGYLEDNLALSIPLVKHERVIDLESCESILKDGMDREISRNFIVQKLKEKQEYRDLFETIFPIKRYMGMYSIMSSSILGGYNKLPTTFESCKQSISFLMKLCSTSAREQWGLIPLKPDQYQKTLTDQFPADPTKASCFGFPGGEFFLQMLEDLAKLALQFPSIIFRGIARVLDPAYQEMREHYLNCDLRRIESAHEDNPYGDFGWKSIAWEGTMDDTTTAGLLLPRGDTPDQRNKEKGAYAPITPIAALDVVYAVTSSWRKLPARLGKTTLKTLAYIYGGNLPFLDMSRGFNIPCLNPEDADDWKKGNKYDVGKYGRYGHALSLWTALALSTPALKSDMILKKANCRVINNEEIPSEECEDY